MDWHRLEAVLLVSLLLGLGACDQFGIQGVIDTCLRNAMKDSAPFASDKERTATEAQLREACIKAAARR